MGKSIEEWAAMLSVAAAASPVIVLGQRASGKVEISRAAAKALCGVDARTVMVSMLQSSSLPVIAADGTVSSVRSEMEAVLDVPEGQPVVLSELDGIHWQSRDLAWDLISRLITGGKNRVFICVMDDAVVPMNIRDRCATFRVDATEPAGLPTGMLLNTKTNRFHPITFRPAPLPGGKTVMGADRYRSGGHHTGGFATLEEAQAWVKEYPSLRLMEGLLWQWDGESVPAMTEWFPVIN